ncbi:Hephaestin-like protein [Gracilariopsis chorda]|uniref:Hephaestin-like protein n=1 Tax=Gracilariopsis chorda TaxID=448386 RepID=A0A2V3ILK8_9FLOR|nr:Hephaestin-like protein [Gracilariopsis chorda]|eukprot:PXF42974.1 Hephaestin-like protein [Gracilariopsis chorda]
MDNEVDFPTAHVHGLVGVTAGGEHVDSILLLPGSTAVVEIVPDNTGLWLFHCHVNNRLHASMQALLSVRPAVTGSAKHAKAVSSFVPNRRRAKPKPAKPADGNGAPPEIQANPKSDNHTYKCVQHGYPGRKTV